MDSWSIRWYLLLSNKTGLVLFPRRLLLFILLYVFSAHALAAHMLFVALNGNDEWSGSLPNPNAALTDGPLASLQVARSRVRTLMQKLPPDGGVVVQVRAGRYELGTPLEFTLPDSGTAASPVIYQAYPGEYPTLSAGKVISQCVPFDKSLLRCDLAGLPLNDLSPLGVPGLGNSSAPKFQLYWGDVRMDIARWPNRDLSDTHGLGAWAHIQQVAGARGLGYTTSMRAERWANPQVALVHLFPKYDWRDQYLGVEGIDLKQRILSLAGQTFDGLHAGRRFYVSNIREELDAPGEWYFDTAKMQLYVYPPKNAQGKLYMSFTQNVIRVSGANHLAFEGLVLEYSNGSAVLLSGNDNRIAGCTMRHTGAVGIEVSGAHNQIVSNELYDLALGGIKVTGGDRNTLLKAENHVHNNVIRDYSRVLEMGYSGIELNGVGQVASNNLIHHAPHWAIIIRGNDHLVEYNEIHHVDQDCDDCGAIVGYGDWTYRGVVLRHNIIHDIVGYGFRNFANGRTVYSSPFAFGAAIYLDGAVSGWTVQGNVVYRTAGPQIFINGGRDHLIENNLLVDSGTGNKFPPLTLNAIPGEAFYKARNIKSLNAVPYQSELWRRRYPSLRGILDGHYNWPEGHVIRHNLSYALTPYPKGFTAYQFQVPLDSVRIEGNFAWNGGYSVDVRLADQERKNMRTLSWEQWQSQVDHGARAIDPRFVNAEGDDFILGASSVLHSLGFDRIPFERIGPHPDVYRPVWPAAVHSSKVDLRQVDYIYKE